MDRNDRELASLIWLGVFSVYAGRSWGVPDASRAVLRAFWHLKLAGTVAMYALYLTGVLLVASRVGLWQTTQTKDTLTSSSACNIKPCWANRPKRTTPGASRGTPTFS